MNQSRTIQALHYPLSVDPGLGRMRRETDYARHVKQLILQVLLTNPGERVNRPDFGCGLRRMLFSAGGPTAASLAQVTITQALDKWLGGVLKAERVDVTAVEEVMRIHLEYSLIASPGRQYLNLEVTP